MTKNVAIIGTGISGLTCGYLLNKTADITVYEANDYIGGHTATKKSMMMELNEILIPVSLYLTIGRTLGL